MPPASRTRRRTTARRWPCGYGPTAACRTILCFTRLLAYLSDLTILSVSLIPHGLSYGPGMVAASLDHAMWFHRPVRADEWVLYDQISPSASGARGFALGRIFSTDGLAATTAQEGLIRVVAPRA